jgi:hypothetical protein
MFVVWLPTFVQCALQKPEKFFSGIFCTLLERDFSLITFFLLSSIQICLVLNSTMKGFFFQSGIFEVKIKKRFMMLLLFKTTFKTAKTEHYLTI